MVLSYLPSELQELVTRYKPGDKISVVYSRNGKDGTANCHFEK